MGALNRATSVRPRAAESGSKGNRRPVLPELEGLPAARAALLQRTGSTVLALQRTHGNHFVQQLLKGPALQRSCACGGTCDKCQTRSEGQMAEPVSSVLQHKGSGQPLQPAVRAFMEPRFGRDFGDVRIHSDAHAAQTAQQLNAAAYTMGRSIFFGAGRYHPESQEGRQLLAHELTHVIQQSAHVMTRADLDRNEAGYERQADQMAATVIREPNQTMHGVPTSTAPLHPHHADRIVSNPSPVLQRRVLDRNVSCRTTGLHGGVPGGTLSGPDAIAVIRAADSRAIEMARRAENMLFLQRLTFGTAAYTPDAGFDTALAARFNLALANPADHRWIEILEREYHAVAGFLDSGAIFYVCRDPACAGEWAFTYAGQHTIRLCNPFWNAGSVNLQGSTLLHEAIHLWWDQIEDQGRPRIHNAHCFEQFALDLAGATAEIPAGFAGACS